MGTLAQPQVGETRLNATLSPRLRLGALALFSSVALVVFIACEGGGQPDGSPSATPPPSSAAADGTARQSTDFDPERALAHVQALAGDIGSRPAGSEAEREAADYIADQFQDYGYQVGQPSFRFEAFIDLGSTLKVISPERQDIDPLALNPTAPGEVEAEIVEAGLGRPQDFPTDSDGKIALIQRGQLFFSDKVANAAAAGAAAAIIYNNQPGQFVGNLFEPSTIPAVSISREDGQLLLGLLDKGPGTVHLDVRVQSGGQSQNVIARPPGGECEVFVGGHYDSVAAGPGANDNASGTATVIEIAHALAADGQFDDVCFLLFGAEEIGLVGSIVFVSSLPGEERRAALGMLNLDMVGVGDRWLLGGSDVLVDIAAQEADRLGLTYTRGQLPPDTSSDHASFLNAGIPAIIIHRLGDPRFHTSEDRVGFMDTALLDDAGHLGLAIIDALLSGR